MNRNIFIGCTTLSGKKMSFNIDTLTKFYEVKIDGDDLYSKANTVLYFTNNDDEKGVYIQETYEQVSEALCR